jgi:large subunit ribosomal protein L17
MKEKAVTHKLFDELKERYLERQGGYIRIVKKGVRKGDGAPVSIVQLLPAEDGAESKKKKSKKSRTAKTTEQKQKKDSKASKAKAAKESGAKKTEKKEKSDAASETD